MSDNQKGGCSFFVLVLVIIWIITSVNALETRLAKSKGRIWALEDKVEKLEKNVRHLQNDR
jgi:CII-binding regulator of phage lambda lysogenization HflD